MLLGAIFLALAILTPVGDRTTFFVFMALTAIFMPLSSPNVIATVYDVTGAGDTVISVLAAGLAAGYSRARRGGRVAVHMARAGDVSKARGLAPGKVQLRRYSTVHAIPLRLEGDLEGP